MAIIRIKDLRLRTIIGTRIEERAKPQEVVMNLTLDYDSEKAASSDDLSDAVNYKSLTDGILAVVEVGRYFLLEKMADDILRFVMEDRRIRSAEVEIDKPAA